MAAVTFAVHRLLQSVGVLLPTPTALTDDEMLSYKLHILIYIYARWIAV